MNNIDDRKSFFIEKLCPELNAEYCDDLNVLNDKFALSELHLSSDEKSDCIVGKIEDYWYCICESSFTAFDRKSRKNYKSIFYSVIMPEKNFPEFELSPKSAALVQDMFSLAFLSPAIFLFLFFLFFMLLICTGLLLNFINDKNPLKLYAFFIYLIPIIITGFAAKFAFKHKNKIFSTLFGQKDYGINNQEFKNKFTVTNVKDNNVIRKLFTSNVCDKILRSKPKLGSIKSKNNCLIIASGDLLSNVTNYKNLLNNVISLVKLFEKQNEKLNSF